jgi:hypothetical protein
MDAITYNYPAPVALQAHCKPQDRAVATSIRNLLRSLGSVVGMAVSTAVQFAVMSSARPQTLPSGLRAQVMDGSWQMGQPCSGAWESDILDAKMKRIRAIFTILVPLMGLCLVGGIFVPNAILKED